MNNPLVSAKWLNNHLQDQDIVLLDASQSSNASAISSEYDQLQIEGARHFDLKDAFSLKTTHLPNMLPSARTFEKACRNLGIHNSSKIIVYDNLGNHFSPRVWWMFKTMGHQDISVLDGGLPNWIAKGYKTIQKKQMKFERGNFNASFNENLVKIFEQIKTNLNNQTHLLIDARPSDRFNGIAPEPRKGLPSGNIKNSINLPYNEVLKNGKFKSKKQLAQVFQTLPIDDRPLIFSCGSGVTACIVLLASELVLENKTSIYDGSWTEWAERTIHISNTDGSHS